MIVRYHALARMEILEAIGYYAGERHELGLEFLEEVTSAIEMIAANPLQFAQVRPGIRRCPVDRFPYGIYYRLPDASTVRIIVVKHHSRRPGLGMRRK